MLGPGKNYFSYVMYYKLTTIYLKLKFIGPVNILATLIFVLIAIISLTLYIYVFVGLLSISQENVSSMMVEIYLLSLSLCSSHLDQCFSMAGPS